MGREGCEWVISISRNKKLCTNRATSFLLEDLGFKFTPTGHTEGERWSWEEKGVWQLQAQEGAGQRGQRDRRLQRLVPGIVRPLPILD